MVSGGKQGRLAGPCPSLHISQGLGVSASHSALQFGEVYTWLVSDSPICFGPDLSLQFGVRVIASSDRKDRKPWWLWSLINTAGSRRLGLGAGVHPVGHRPPSGQGWGPWKRSEVQGCVLIY